jgi:4-amino-4-deoxy-L-arabinose transferase-like glycosyltransferase
MTKGVDDRGYAFPVYFVAWGSGMSVLYSYLAIPLFRLFGVTLGIYRIPQAFFGVLSVLACYLLVKKMFSKNFALFTAFMLSINPWHIMITRFGLDADLAPAMFLIGLTCLVYGITRKKQNPYPAAVFMGATLYCYAQTWITVPIFLVLFILCYHQQMTERRSWIKAGLLLGIIALPLMYFLAVNLGILPEIRTPFFSIPKLLGFRGGELSLGNLKQSIKDILRVILSQTDGISYTSSTLVGACYFFTTPFMLFGVIRHLILFFSKVRSREKDIQFVFLLWLISAAITAVLNQSITTIHINMLYLPVIFYGAYGMWEIAHLVRSKMFLPICILFLCFSFCLFGKEYLTTEDGHFFDEKGEQAIEYAKATAGEKGEITFYKNTSYKYSNLMWYEKFDPVDFSRNAVYGGENGFEDMISYGRFHYIDSPDEIKKGGVYILETNQRECFEDLGFQVKVINSQFDVAVWRENAK